MILKRLLFLCVFLTGSVCIGLFCDHVLHSTASAGIGGMVWGALSTIYYLENYE